MTSEPLAVTPGPPQGPWRSPTAPAPPSKWSAMVAAPRAPASALLRFLASLPRDAPLATKGLHRSSLAGRSGTALAVLDRQPETDRHRQLYAPCIIAGAVPHGIHPSTSSGSSLPTPSEETTARIHHTDGSESSSLGASPIAIRSVSTTASGGIQPPDPRGSASARPNCGLPSAELGSTAGTLQPPQRRRSTPPLANARRPASLKRIPSRPRGGSLADHR